MSAIGRKETCKVCKNNFFVQGKVKRSTCVAAPEGQRWLKYVPPSHTPGPWKVEAGGDRVISKTTGTIIAEVLEFPEMWDEEQANNVRL